MSRRHARLQKCPASRKARFRDKREATLAIHSAVTARRYADELGIHTARQERRAYRCESCKGWHLTSSDYYPQPRVGDVAAFVRPGA
mgnify:CR=1